jgi:uncharacterized protein (TIGR03663 family)
VSADTVARPEPAPRATRRRPNAELVAWVVLIALALALRLIALGDRVLHHDESQDAYFSWIFYTRGDYEYDPLLHGPLRFYLTAGMYGLFGVSDFTARLAPALMGTAAVALPALLRDQLGRVGAFAAAVLLAIGPSYLFFSRFAREDIYVACLTLALLAVCFRFLDRPRRHQPAVIGALLALSFATKETTFITVFVAGTFVLAVLAWRRELILGPVRAVGLEAWGWGVAAFLGTFTLLFTTFFTHPTGLWDGIYTGLEYWLSQHDVARGGNPWFYYVVVLVGREWPVLVLGAVGAAAAFKRPTLLRAFLVWAFVVSLIVYSWAGERFEWLVLHPLLPLVLLAGVGVQAIWESRRWYGIPLVAVALAYVVFASWSLSAAHPGDPRELLVSAQTAPEVSRIAEQLRADAARAERDGRPYRVTVDAADGATFPWAWYFRDLDVGFQDLATSGTPPPSDALILTETSRDRLEGTLTGMTARRFPLRIWWVPDYGRMRLRWLLDREPWNPTGGLPEWLYVRPGVR